MPSVTIFGAGAVGQFLAVKLASAGSPVTAVCRGTTLEALKAAGMHLLSHCSLTLDDVGNGETLRTQDVVICSAEEAAAQPPADFLISTLKGNQLPAALPQLRPLVTLDTTLVLLQNGLPFFHNSICPNEKLQQQPLESVDPGGRLVQAFDLNTTKIVGCVAHIAAAQSGPAMVRNTFKAGATRFEIAAVGKTDACKADQLLQILELAGIDATKVDSLLKCIWSKLCVSAGVNSTNLLTSGYADDLVRNEATATIIQAIYAEVIEAGSTAGVALDLTAADQMAYSKDCFQHSKFSMLQDAEAGRRLEVGPYMLAVQEVARLLCVATPTLDTVTALVQHFDANIARRQAGR